MAGKGKGGTEICQSLHEFGRAAEGVEQEFLRRWLGGEGIEQRFPSLEGVDGERQASLAGKGELREEDLALEVERGCCDPAVEAAFADGSGGEAVEIRLKGCEPGGGSEMGFPGMQPEGGGDEIREAFGEGGHCFPVVLAGAVDHASGDSRGLHFGDDPGGIGKALQVVVRVVEEHGGRNDEGCTGPRIFSPPEIPNRPSGLKI